MSLEQIVALHRSMLRDELYFAPSQSHPPVAYTYDSKERTMVPDDRPLVITPPAGGYIEVPDSATQSTSVGQPMSGRMLRYLMGPASDTPWAHAAFLLRAWCRREHREHRGADKPYWRGSLCHQLVRFTVIEEWSIDNAARILRLDQPEPVLRMALAWIEASIDRDRERAEKRAREDAGTGPGAVPVPPSAHHAPSLEHIAECPNPECRKRREAA